MKFLLSILLLFSLAANAQFGDRNFFGKAAMSYTRQNLITLPGGVTVANADDAFTLPLPFQSECYGSPGGIFKSNDISVTNKAYKFVVDKTDVQCANGRRAEFSNYSDVLTNGYVGYERWIGFNIYVPGSWTFETNPILTNIIHQWHDNEQGGETGYKSAFEFVISTDKFAYNTRACANESGSGFVEEFHSMELYNPSIVRDAWHSIVIHLVFQNPATAQGNQARVQIWIDGTKASDPPPLQMGYNHIYSPFFKIGNYSWAWNDDNLACCGNFTVVTTRTHYVDNVRIGTELATYNDVVPETMQ